MMTPETLRQATLLLDQRVRDALTCHWEADHTHPRVFGLGSFESQQARERALNETRQCVRNCVPNDHRPVGVQAPQEVVYLGDVLREAVEQIAYEIECAQPARVKAIAKKVQAWDDARQCAEDLAIRPVEGHAAALDELRRVGLGWTVDAARIAASRPR